MMIDYLWMSWVFVKILFEFCRNDKNVGNDGNFDFLFCRHIRQP
jgi:hypothetical protein